MGLAVGWRAHQRNMLQNYALVAPRSLLHTYILTHTRTYICIIPQLRPYTHKPVCMYIHAYARSYHRNKEKQLREEALEAKEAHMRAVVLAHELEALSKSYQNEGVTEQFWGHICFLCIYVHVSVYLCTYCISVCTCIYIYVCIYYSKTLEKYMRGCFLKTFFWFYGWKTWGNFSVC